MRWWDRPEYSRSTAEMGIVLPCALQDRPPPPAMPPLGGSLIAQPGQAFVPAQNRQNIEDARRGGAPGQRHPQRLRYGAQLEIVRFGEGPRGGFGGFCSPRRYGFECVAKFADQFPGFRRQQRRSFWLDL